MSTGRAGPVVVTVYVSSLLIGVASELPHARPVIGSTADITDMHIKIRGLGLLQPQRQEGGSLCISWIEHLQSFFKLLEEFVWRALGSTDRCKVEGQNNVINPAKGVNGTIVSVSASGLVVGPGPCGSLRKEALYGLLWVSIMDSVYGCIWHLELRASEELPEG
eukprot:1149272-Pelagomonas_calceolata.AAC.1